MKILTIIGSRRKKGNTANLVQATIKGALEADPKTETETLFLGDLNIQACTGCEGCRNSWNCIIKDDYPGIIRKIDTCDAVILASPTYWYSVTSDMKRFIDRSYSLIQYPSNRHEWISKYTGSGKRSISLAVCEQQEEAMMGNTLTLLRDFSRDIGLDPVDSLAALGFFEAGSIRNAPELLHRAEETGKKLIS